MSPLVKQGWSKPSTILFATELPANEKAFAFALAQAKEVKARLILFHAYDTLVVSASETSGVRYFDYAAAARTETAQMEPLIRRSRDAGVETEAVVRPGLAADQILECAMEKNADRIVLGTRSPGTLGKILIGSVAEAVLRSAAVPCCIVGPDTVDQAYQGYNLKTILCATALSERSYPVVDLAAQIAAEHGARLIVQHVLRQNERSNMEGRTLEQMEAEVLSMIPLELQNRISVEPIVVPGDPAEEVLFQAKTQKVDLIVTGAQAASTISTLTRQGVAYRIVAHAPCPVITVAPIAIERARNSVEKTGELTGAL